MNNQLAFRDVNFNVITRNNQTWLSSKDLAQALDYKNTKSITNLFNENEDEFTPTMSLVIESVTNGINGSQRRLKTRIFSLRGAHLIAMFARTETAKEFRRWVLDILDREVVSCSRKTSTDERTPLRDAINMLVGKKGIMYPEAYSFIHQRFNVAHIDELEADQLPVAIEYVHRLVLEGEFLGKQETLPAARLSLSYGMEWLEQYRWLIGDAAKGKAWNYPAKLLTANSDNPNPIGRMLVELKDSGYVVDAAMFQLQAMQHHLDVFRRKISTAITTLQ